MTGLEKTIAAIQAYADEMKRRATEAHETYGMDWEERGKKGNLLEFFPEGFDGLNYLSWADNHDGDEVLARAGLLLVMAFQMIKERLAELKQIAKKEGVNATDEGTS